MSESPHCNVPDHVHPNAPIWNHATDVKYDDLEVGMRLIVDDCFDCVPELSIVEVQADSSPPEDPSLKFYFYCTEGKHFLDGQIDFEGEFLVGVRQARAFVAESDPRTTNAGIKNFHPVGLKNPEEISS